MEDHRQEESAAGTVEHTGPHPVGRGFVVTCGVLLAVLAALLLCLLSSFLISLVLAVFLALGLDPTVRRLQRRGLSRGWSVAVVALGFLVVVGLVVVFVVPTTIRQFSHALTSLPAAVEAMKSSDWFAWLQQLLGTDLDAAADASQRSLLDLSSFLTVSGGLLRAGFGLVGAVSTAVIVVVLTLYFVVSLDATKRAVGLLVPLYRRARFAALLDEITGSVGGVISGAVILSTLNAGVVLVLNLALGSPIAVLMTIVAFFVTLVPLVGSVLNLVIGALAALVVGPWACLIYAVVYLVYVQVEAYVITPRVMGRAVAVPGVLVIIGAVAGATLMGLFGALVAIPVTASILIVVREVVIPRQQARSAPPSP